MVAAQSIAPSRNRKFLLSSLLLGILVFSACTQPSPTATLDSSPVSPLTPNNVCKELSLEKGINEVKQYNASPPMGIDPSQKITATMHTNKGIIVFDLFSEEVPKTVNNFVFLAREGFYDGVIFHRIIKGFMIQSGDPTGTGSGGPGYRFEDEQVTRDYLPGTLAMANAGPNTNGSQFFVMHDRGNLPKLYTIFGQVNEGLSVVNDLANVPVTTGSSGELSKPLDPPFIECIEITAQAS